MGYVIYLLVTICINVPFVAIDVPMNIYILGETYLLVIYDIVDELIDKEYLIVNTCLFMTAHDPRWGVFICKFCVFM